MAYHPTQRLDTSQSQNQNSVSESLQQILPARSSHSPMPSPSSRQERRGLPNRVVTDENFDDTYVDFRKIFRAPPKSDGKTFSTFTLFELIRKLEQKELKTWAQLAIDLGVEPPALDKGQSAQKVQQYAVRLKVSSFSPSIMSILIANLNPCSDGCMQCTLMHSLST